MGVFSYLYFKTLTLASRYYLIFAQGLQNRKSDRRFLMFVWILHNTSATNTTVNVRQNLLIWANTLIPYSAGRIKRRNSKKYFAVCI